MIEIIKVVASLWLATVVHEGGHIVTANMVGGSVYDVKLYPNNGHFATVYIDNKTAENPLVIAGGIMASNLSLPAISWAKEKYPEQTFFNYWDFWARMDFPVNAISSIWDNNNDTSKFCDNTGIPKAVPIALSLVYIKVNKNVFISNGKICFKKAF